MRGEAQYEKVNRENQKNNAQKSVKSVYRNNIIYRCARKPQQFNQREKKIFYINLVRVGRIVFADFKKNIAQRVAFQNFPAFGDIVEVVRPLANIYALIRIAGHKREKQGRRYHQKRQTDGGAQYKFMFGKKIRHVFISTHTNKYCLTRQFLEVCRQAGRGPTPDWYSCPRQCN